MERANEALTLNSSLPEWNLLCEKRQVVSWSLDFMEVALGLLRRFSFFAKNGGTLGKLFAPFELA